jgi:hypothetical protein
MERVAKVGKFLIETNGSGEVFITVGKTGLRISDIRDCIMVTFTGNGKFIPHNVNGLPAMVFRGIEKKLSIQKENNSRPKSR